MDGELAEVWKTRDAGSNDGAEVSPGRGEQAFAMRRKFQRSEESKGGESEGGEGKSARGEGTTDLTRLEILLRATPRRARSQGPSWIRHFKVE